MNPQQLPASGLAFGEDAQLLGRPFGFIFRETLESAPLVSVKGGKSGKVGKREHRTGGPRLRLASSGKYVWRLINGVFLRIF